MKKKITAVLICTAILGLTGCGGSVDTTNRYEYAIIKLPDGQIVTGDVNSKMVHSSGMLSIEIDGDMYYTHGANVVLIRK